MTLAFSSLLEYTDWERQKWLTWLRTQGGSVLALSIGPHGDGRFVTLNDLIKHIFSAEKRYLERLSGRPLTDPSSIRADSLEELFEFGEQSRKDLRTFVQTMDPREWDVLHEYIILKYSVQATPRKIVLHILVHELRHWAQIATILRFSGVTTGETYDVLRSPVLGGAFCIL